jgi:hypothetical protein
MGQEQAAEPRYGPKLLFEEQSFPCGYAPRALVVSQLHPDTGTVFVGCKDGSITVLRPKAGPASAGPLALGDFDAVPLPERPGSSQGAIRALCEWDESHLLVARRDGNLEVVCWADPAEPPKRLQQHPDPIRTLVHLDQDRVAVAYRRQGLTVLYRGPEPREVGGGERGAIQGIRSIFPLWNGTDVRDAKDGDRLVWLVLTDRGALYEWDGEAHHPPSPVAGNWTEGRPSLISDFCLLPEESGLRATEALVATDRGLYLLFYQDGDGGRKLSSRRLALSGLNATPSALAYTSSRMFGGTLRELLWVTDFQGDNHLFWGERRPGEEREPAKEWRFSRSGVHQARSETLLCSFLPSPSGQESPFFVVQIRRDDRIVLGRYWTPESDEGGDPTSDRPKDVALQRLLYFGRYEDYEVGAESIRRYLDERIDEEHQIEEEKRQDWGSERDAAIVSELFEYLAEDADRRRILLESLRSPYAEGAQRILSSHAGKTSRLWRLALLGILHRSPGEQTASYLGLMRWLRHRQGELPAGEEFESLRRDLDFDLLLVRKWGLSGSVNNDRKDLVRPQRVLLAQARELSPSLDGSHLPKDQQLELERLLWEGLTYQAELFGRGVSRMHENDQGRLRGRTAWATSVLQKTKPTLVAVSWIWGGVEVFALQGGERNPKLDFVAGDYGPESGPHLLVRKQLDKERIVPAKYGYSRVVHLGKVDEQPYLLSAPAADPLEKSVIRSHAELFVWYLRDLLDDREKVIEPDRILLEGVERESIYSLLDLEEGRLVAGLRGEGLQTFLALIDIKAKTCTKIPVAVGQAAQKEEVAGGPEEPRSPGRNRMWSLAPIPDSSSLYFRIAFGCDSGEIYELKIDWTARTVAKGEGPQLIGRMGSPVNVLTCRRLADSRLRVYAGGDNGAIVAWQEILPQERDDTGARFGTLWATVEEGAISLIHGLKIEQGKPSILAVTRQGRYVAFDDREWIDPPVPRDHPTRISVPGSRYGRRLLHSSAFASSWIEETSALGPCWEAAEKLGAFAALLLATDDGCLRLVSLHHAEATEHRKAEYRTIVDLWHKVLQRPLDFRLTEAAYKSSPTLSLIVVRYLLDEPLDQEKPFSREPFKELTVSQALLKFPWCLPRHLRPLFRLRLLWDDLRAGRTYGYPRKWKRFERLLSAALERAWRLDDLDLFKEICQVVLRKANADLYKAGEEPPRLPRIPRGVASQVFLRVLSSIEHTLPRWLSADRQREARARIAVAKHLVDGETARVLFRKAAREARSKARKKEPARAVRQDPARLAKLGPFQRALAERIRSVRELVNKRHHLVSLESLRAANLSLMRMCRSLVAQREQFKENRLYKPGLAGDDLLMCEVDWPIFEPYADEIITAAVRAFQTPLELNDALAHEFSRSFALFICACPSATLPIESLLTARLRVADPEYEDGIFYRIFAQLKVLRAIGIGAPPWADELLRLGTQPPKEGWSWAATENALPRLKELGAFSYIKGDGSREKEEQEKLAGRLGRENATNLRNLRTAYGILGKLDQLNASLEITASGLDLNRGWGRDLRERAGRLEGDHSHSRSFFGEIFKPDPLGPEPFQPEKVDGFDELMPPNDRRPEELREVQPALVRLAQPLADWADRCVGEINRRAREGELFQPEVTIYSRIFRRLGNAAKNFPTSAAVQANVIYSVLGHHLLEDLDEHALELEEIAEVLNPRQVWDFRDQGRRRAATVLPKGKDGSTAERFAAYLLGRARSAESIPKNLRLLRALFGAPESDPGEKPLEALLWDFQGPQDEEFSWRQVKKDGVEPATMKLRKREPQYLSLVLAELDQNQRKHAWPDNWTEAKEHPEFSFAAEGVLEIRFPFAVTKPYKEPGDMDLSTNLGRLRDRQRNGFGSLMPPNQNPDVPSSGTGFYLADLAAAIIGWKLRLDCPDLVPEAGVQRFKITLFRSVTETRKGADS